MSWYDGTEKIDFERFNNEFSVAVAEGIFFSADFRKLAIVNSFEEGTDLYNLSDPHVENDDYTYVFYHIVTGENVKRAENEIKRYVKACKDEEEIYLYKVINNEQTGEKSLLRYSKGHICPNIIMDPKLPTRVLPENLKSEKFFIIPLKRYEYRCPVCKSRTLPDRGFYFICSNCGWADQGTDDEDEVPCFLTCEYSIREYREKYLQVKKQHPEYDWHEFFNECIVLLDKENYGDDFFNDMDLLNKEIYDNKEE